MSNNQEYDDLKTKYIKLQLELETVNQALHDCRRQVTTKQTLEAEYQEEIRILQTQGTVQEQKLKTKVQQLEDTNTNLKTTFNEQISCLEKELLIKDDNITELKKEIDNILEIRGTQEPIADISIIEEINDLKQLNFELSERINALEKTAEQTGQQNVKLQATVRQLEEELENYKETLKCKREELDEANNLIQTLKDDYICVKSELDVVKSKPLDNQSRGNSLFAEVDDRRLQLQQKYQTMKTAYLEMRRERANYLKQITSLRQENSMLIELRESEIAGKERDDETIAITYKNQIQCLNDVLDSYQKELKQKTIHEVDRDGVYEFYKSMIEMKNEEVAEMRQQLLDKALNHTTLSYDYIEASRQVRRYKLEIIKLKNEIGKLEVKIQEMEMAANAVTENAALPSPPPTEIKQLKSIVKNTDSCDKGIDDKENDNTENKKVQFAESTAEPLITDKFKPRKGAKIMICKPTVFFPSGKE